MYNLAGYFDTHIFTRLHRFARNDIPSCHCEESTVVDDEAITFFDELTQQSVQKFITRVNIHKLL